MLEDPASSPERRLGAALALTSVKDPEAVAESRTRVRVVADSSAEPAMKEALSRIAEGSDADVAVLAALPPSR